MAATANGTTYTVHDTTLAAGTPGRVIVPDGCAGIFLYCHGNNGNYLDLGASGSFGKWFQVVVGEYRLAVAEATAGVSATDAGGNNYGNNYGRTVYEQVLAYADSLVGGTPGPVIVQGSSAGGMISAWLAAQAPFLAGRIAGWISHRGVVNAHRWRVGNEKGLGSTAPTPYDPEWQKAQLAVFNAAYGATLNTQTAYDASVVPARDPMLFPDADWQRVPYTLTVYGGADSVVPPYWHGTKLHTERLAPLLGDRSTHRVTPGATHGINPAPSTFDEDTLLRSWLAVALGETGGPTPPPPVLNTNGSRAAARMLAAF
jgi:acetyl esterase/lipase